MLNFKRNIYPLLIAVLCCTAFSSCASIIHGTRQKVTVTSLPEGATVSDGERTFTTPCVLNLKRNKDHMLTISKPGYQTETAQLTHVISGAVAGNIIAGGPIGWGVDAISGAQWRLVPDALSVRLNPVSPIAAVAVKNLEHDTVEAKLQNLEDLKQKNLISDVEYEAMKKIALNTTPGQ